MHRVHLLDYRIDRTMINTTYVIGVADG